MTKYYFGLIAEFFIILLYKIRFYQILKHRTRNYAGEIDVIALRGKQIVFIEVKARSNDFDHDNIILQSKQQNRITRAAQIFLHLNPKYKMYNIRFDLAIVRKFALPVIIKNAW